MLIGLKKIIKKPWVWFRHISRKKKIFVIIGLIIIFFIISSAIANSTKPPPYTLGKAEITDLKEVVSETGNIITNNTTDVYSPTNGIVEEVYVANGEAVKEGQELFKVKSTATEQETHQAHANYLAAVAALNAAKSTADSYRAGMYTAWKQYTDLSTSDRYENDNGSPRSTEREAAEFQVAQDNWKAAEAKYKDQETAIAQAQAAVNAALLAYQATQNATVKAQIDGTIANLSVSEGNAVKAQTQSLSAAPIHPALTITNSGATEARVVLSESDAIKVEPGQDVDVEIKALDEKKFRGRVVRVDDIATNNQGVIQYNAYVQLYNPGPKLKSGMTVDVTIVTKQVKDVLTVPNSAVKPYKGGRAVRVIDPKTKEPTFVPVEIGVKGETRTQILKGLSEGQEVVTALSNDQLKRQSPF